VGDIRATLQKLLPRLAERQDDNFLQECQTLHQKSLHWLAEQEKPGHNGLIHPQYLVKLIDEMAAEDAFWWATPARPWSGCCATPPPMASAARWPA
jgi:pyruvate dehydrogenase (quinone)